MDLAFYTLGPSKYQQTKEVKCDLPRHQKYRNPRYFALFASISVEETAAWISPRQRKKQRFQNKVW